MALIAVILAFVMLIILPTNQRIQEKEILKSDLELQQMEIQTKLALEDTLKEKQEEKLVMLNDEFSEIEKPLVAAEYERWVLPLTDKYRMRITQASLGDLEVATPNSQVVLVSEPSYRIRELVLEYLGESIEEDFIPTSGSVLLKQTHTYNVITNFENYKAFLDDVSEWDTTVFISGSTYNFDVNTATFAFDVYSVHKIEYEEGKDYSGDYYGLYFGNPSDPNDPGTPTDPTDPVEQPTK